MEYLPNESPYFFGVVEDRDDPLQQGRVKVRVAGVHPFSRIQGDYSGISVEDLPWMNVILPVTSAGISGISGGNTGLVRGSNVYGQWLDKYRIAGVVTGVCSGRILNIPDPTDGFSDPSGQYPSATGNSTNGLGQGSIIGATNGYNVTQGINISVGINPNGSLANQPEDPDTDYTIRAMLIKDENVRYTVYWVNGLPHIGVGHLLLNYPTRNKQAIAKKASIDIGRNFHPDNVTITPQECEDLFNRDVSIVLNEINKYALLSTVYRKMSEPRKMALINMCFQMGTGGVAKFKKMLTLLNQGRYKEAGIEAKDSDWYDQTTDRAERVIKVLINNNFLSYGIKPKTSSNGRSVAMASSFYSGFNPLDPNADDTYDPLNWNAVDNGEPPVGWKGIEWWEKPKPKDPDILFVEPEPSYGGEYPYVNVSTSEGGHVTEIDNTPGRERSRYIHPNGSYTETSGSSMIHKSTTDYYGIVNGTSHHLVGGDRLSNIGGNETVYNMGGLDHTIDGNRTANIKGDDIINVTGSEVKTITGDGTIKVSGNLTIIVEGNADMTINGNSTSKVAGNASISADGSMDLKTGSNFSLVAGGNVSIQGSRIDLKG